MIEDGNLHWSFEPDSIEETKSETKVIVLHGVGPPLLIVQRIIVRAEYCIGSEASELRSRGWPLFTTSDSTWCLLWQFIGDPSNVQLST